MSNRSTKIEGHTKGRRMSKPFRAKAIGVKVRVKLPPIESYEKEVDFRLEGSGRVIVRLERLMGSDRVRLTDAKFMKTFLQKLEEEERKAWDKRTKARKKAERIRARNLAINGFMEPTDDMQDLLAHPVFRVNRVLKKLELHDQNMSVGKVEHPTPIIEIEPFEFDGSGAIFKTYPHHVQLKNEGSLSNALLEEPELKPSPSPSMVEVGATDEDSARHSTLPTIDTKLHSPENSDEGEDGKNEEDEDEHETNEGEGDEEEINEDEGDEETVAPLIQELEDEWAGEGAEEEGQKKIAKIPPSNPLIEDLSLTALQQSYGIPPDEDLSPFAPFRSDLVDLIYTDVDGGILQLYQTAEEITEVYERESLTTDEFVTQLTRIMRDTANSGGGTTST